MGARAEHSLLRQLVTGLVLILVSPLLALLVLLYFPFLAAYGLVLHIAAWMCWCTRGKHVLIVYSNSPVWQPYFESQLLPALESRAVILNWSERATWPTWTLAYMVFRFFGGDRNFNPMAIVFRPGRFRRVFRFWKPFRDFKYGKPEAVERMKDELLGIVPPTSAGSATATPKTGGV